MPTEKKTITFQKVNWKEITTKDKRVVDLAELYDEENNKYACWNKQFVEQNIKAGVPIEVEIETTQDGKYTNRTILPPSKQRDQHEELLEALRFISEQNIVVIKKLEDITNFFINKNGTDKSNNSTKPKYVVPPETRANPTGIKESPSTHPESPRI